MLDREESQELSLEVCTNQKKPLAYLSKDIVVSSNNKGILQHHSASSSAASRAFVTFTPEDATEKTPALLSTVPGKFSKSSSETTFPPTTITALSIDPLVRSLPPSALLRERLQRERILGSAGSQNINRHKLPKEETLGKLLSSRRILSQQSKRSKRKISKRDTAKVTRGFRDKTGRFVPIQYLRKNGTLESPCASIKLTLLDANDNNPVFVPGNQYEFTIFDDSTIGQLVGTVTILASFLPVIFI